MNVDPSAFAQRPFLFSLHQQRANENAITIAGMDVVDQLHPHTGFLMLSQSRLLEEVTMTSIAVDEEYWLALRHPAESRKAGYELLTRNHAGFAALGDPEKEALWREFRAYIRQAEGFYRGAAVLPRKSSPLNYYYAFMNLAKAAALANGLLKPQPAEQQRVLHHGVSAEVVSGDPDEWCLTVRRPHDIFGLVYAMAVGTVIPKGTKLEAHRLLNYVMPVQWQMGKLGYGPPPWSSGTWVLCVNKQASNVWDLIGLHGHFPINKMPVAFQALYQEVKPEGVRPFAWDALKLHAIQVSSMRFIQRTLPLPTSGDIQPTLRAAAPYCLYPNYAGTKSEHIILCLPYDAAGAAVPMNELVASYGVMYFLSSLVRYHPDYMDRIGESNDAWLIESFAKSTPLVLLRSLASEILGYCLKIVTA